MSDLRAKEVKRAALTEILDHITMVSGALIVPVYPALIQMVLYPCTHPHVHTYTHTHAHTIWPAINWGLLLQNRVTILHY